ncbi:hypothetical protein D0A34_07635 [Microcoleus vaginatus PCC 9802]|nr:hypothetical protein MicvaDRAFT_0315 [Microcoleus vaginatus FGP-2]UNU18766.1 hypothetical protein D0A34_07635 [Microcoleus vaginatus PCC 9802]
MYSLSLLILTYFGFFAPTYLMLISINLPEFEANQPAKFTLNQTSIRLHLRLKIPHEYFCQKPNPKTIDITAKIKYESLPLKRRP